MFEIGYLRKLHRKVAPIILIPLLLTAFTGMGYRIGRNWFGFSDQIAESFLFVHEGRFLGSSLVPIYVFWVGLGLLGMIVTGFFMMSNQRKTTPMRQKKDWRWFHRMIAPIAMLPLFVSAITGIIFRLGQAWFGLPNEQAAILLQIHQGGYLGGATFT
jgi:hypothetical protein